MNKPKGLNGEPIWSCEDVIIGTVSGEDYGKRRNLRVGVDIRIERIAGPKQTVTHEETTDFLDFSITTHVWNPRGNDWEAGGATVAPLRQIVNYAAPFNEASVLEIAELGKWHLNALTAGCVHQPKGKDLPMRDGKYSKEIDLDAIPLCPESGYKYGSAWLVRPLPADLLDTVRRLFEGADPAKIYDADRITSQ